MKAIERDLFTKFEPLSDIQLSADGKEVYFLSTKADLKENNYHQKLWRIDRKSGKVSSFLSYRKKMRYFVLREGIFLLEESKKEGYTAFKRLEKDGKITKAFELPLSVDSVEDFDKNHYLITSTVNRAKSRFYALERAKQKEILEEEKRNSDYIVLDEYPFCYNGAGITNGNRNTLFLVNKKTLKIKRVTSETMDVESYDVKKGKILYSGVDFTNFKGKWSWVYEYDLKTGKTAVLYDKKIQIQRVFYYNGEKIVMGTFAEDYGAMEASKFYSLKDGKMKKLCDNEYTFYNAVLCDVRYGKTKAFQKKGDQVYLTACDDDKTILVRFTGKKIEKVLEKEGTVDDFCLDPKDGSVCAIAMIGQALEEVYEYKDGSFSRLTSINGKVLEDRYVAKPEEVIVGKEMPVKGWVLKPKDYDPEKTYPGILDIHGGPKCAYGPIYMHEMQVWASAGYFVFFCDPRGSDGRGNAFADLRHGGYGSIDYEDIMDFTDEVLKRYPNIDKERLGVTGGSYGGYMTNWIVGHTDRFKAAATQRSIANWITEVTISDYGIDFPIEMEFDDVRHCEKELWDISPLKYVNNVKTPILFIHSTEDYRCTLPEALQFYTPITINGVETRMVIFKGENHELSRNGKPLHRLKRLDEISDWMDRHLK